MLAYFLPFFPFLPLLFPPIHQLWVSEETLYDCHSVQGLHAGCWYMGVGIGGLPEPFLFQLLFSSLTYFSRNAF